MPGGRPSLGVRQQILLRFPPNLVEEINAKRGPKTMNSWMEDAAKLALRPTSAVLMPDLLVEEHEHRMVPHRTESINGQLVRWRKCMDCDVEVKS